MHIDLRPRHLLLTLFPFFTVAIVLLLRPFPVAAVERGLEEQAAPTDIVLSNNQVDENQPAGALVGTLRTVDADPGDTHTYRLIGGATTYFAVDGDRLETAQALDFEAVDRHQLWIRSTDAAGQSFYKSFIITVADVNEAPTIEEGATVARTMSEDGSPSPFVLTLNARDVDAGDTFSWSVVSPAAHGRATAGGSGSSQVVGYVPYRNYHGSDSFEVQVADSGGLTDTIRVSVTVEPVNDAPNARDDSVTTAEERAITISPLRNDGDVDGDAITLVVVGEPAHGQATHSGDRITYTPEADFVGRDLITYGISDGTLTAYATINIYVTNVNDAPSIVEGTSASVTMSEDGAPTPFALALSATDIDSSTVQWAILRQPAHGAATATSTGPFTGATSYTPDLHYHGSDTFQVQVSDGQAADVIRIDVTLEPVNDPPLGVDDTAETAEETAVTIDVLANDLDVVEGSPLTIQDAGLPAHGTATVNGDNKIVYTPQADFYGTDTFVYTLSDGEATGTATVIVTVRNSNDAPVIGIVEEVQWELVGPSGFSAPVVKSFFYHLIW